MRISKSCHLRFYEPSCRCNTSKVPAHSWDQTKAAEEERLVIELPLCCLFHNLLAVALTFLTFWPPAVGKHTMTAPKITVSSTAPFQSCHLFIYFFIIITHKHSFLIALLIHPWLLWNNIYRNAKRHMTFRISKGHCDFISYNCSFISHDHFVFHKCDLKGIVIQKKKIF